ncbi:MAG TPA: cupin domain-containing protein [Xanthobacteraceae bacterium]|nr:cupin domain-containing protein [Xanthobacteraceae bacterium]
MSDPLSARTEPHKTEIHAPGAQAAAPPFSRRRFLGTTGVAAGTAGFALARGAAAQSVQSATAGEHNASASDPGPQNKVLQNLNPNSFTPPATDHGLPPTFWNSFSAMHRRIQDGGWSRQVTVHDLPISKDIAGVNMRLTAGGIRELHWHEANEWAIMLYGNARLTALTIDGTPYVNDVAEGDLWYFPTGVPHSIQGLGPDGCEFLLVFDDGTFSEDNTTLLSDWMIHTPREVVAKNWGVPQSALDPFKTVPPEGRFIFQAAVPPPLPQDQAAAADNGRADNNAFQFRLNQMKPQKSDRMGQVKIVDSTNFPAAANIAMAHVTVKPGGMREMHWHPNANEWQYYIKGKGRMTVFFNHADSRTIDFNAGDVGYVPQPLGHYIENTGDSDLVFLEMFHASHYQDISLNDWLTHLPPELVTAHLGISRETLAAIPKANLALVPA